MASISVAPLSKCPAIAPIITQSSSSVSIQNKSAHSDDEDDQNEDNDNNVSGSVHAISSVAAPIPLHIMNEGDAVSIPGLVWLEKYELFLI